MSKHDKQAEAGRQTQGADSGRGDDPMTSYDPEADAGEGAAEQTAGRAPAEHAPPGNGSNRAAGETQQEAPAQAPQGGAEPAGAAEAGHSELEQAREDAVAHYDRFLRLQAEFENYKRRILKEHADALRFALAPLVTEMAAIVDNLERAIEHAGKEQSDGVEALLAGIELVLKQMREALGRFGVTRIEAVGKPFDPSQHEAINVVETDDVPENQVLDEYQAGYLLHDRVIRPARVSVSKRAGPGGGEAPPAGH
jgi:molecular chaperone GrpE